MDFQTKTPEREIIEGNTIFANNLYKILAKKPGNVLFSPLSIHIALSILHQGAEEASAKALEDVLKISNKPKTAEGYHNLIKSIKSWGQITLLMANKIYLNSTHQMQLAENFEKSSLENFDSQVEFVNFTHKLEAAKRINEWVEAKTENKIKNLVNEACLSDNTKMLIINAIFFKGKWMNQFNKMMTLKSKFFLENNKEIQVDMMYQKATFNYKLDEELGAQILELPYKGRHVKMLVVLPEKNTNLEKVEEQFSKLSLRQVCSDFSGKEVKLYLPKFKIEETIKLNDVLIEMGLGDIFDMKKAKLGGILATKHGLFVSDVLQKVFIEVSETGTVAAAATLMYSSLGGDVKAPEPKVFRVDHPAIFLLVSHHDTTPNCLFYGRLTHPHS